MMAGWKNAIGKWLGWIAMNWSGGQEMALASLVRSWPNIRQASVQFQFIFSQAEATWKLAAQSGLKVSWTRLSIARWLSLSIDNFHLSAARETETQTEMKNITKTKNPTKNRCWIDTFHLTSASSAPVNVINDNILGWNEEIEGGHALRHASRHCGNVARRNVLECSRMFSNVAKMRLDNRWGWAGERVSGWAGERVSGWAGWCQGEGGGGRGNGSGAASPCTKEQQRILGTATVGWAARCHGDRLELPDSRPQCTVIRLRWTPRFRSRNIFSNNYDRCLIMLQIHWPSFKRFQLLSHCGEIVESCWFNMASYGDVASSFNLAGGCKFTRKNIK